jgi:hypothetical protein
VLAHLAHPRDRDAGLATSAEAAMPSRSPGGCEFPAALATELINVLAAITLAGTTCAPAPP